MDAEVSPPLYADAQLARMERLATVIDRATPVPGGLMALVSRYDTPEGYSQRAARSTPRWGIPAIPDDR